MFGMAGSKMKEILLEYGETYLNILWPWVMDVPIMYLQ
jgi:hypothetical protein